MNKCDSCIDFERKLDIAKIVLDGHILDRKFYMIALNLSGKRETLEKNATKLIEKHGIIKALKESRKRKDK